MEKDGGGTGNRECEIITHLNIKQFTLYRHMCTLYTQTLTSNIRRAYRQYKIIPQDKYKDIKM